MPLPPDFFEPLLRALPDEATPRDLARVLREDFVSRHAAPPIYQVLLDARRAGRLRPARDTGLEIPEIAAWDGFAHGGRPNVTPLIAPLVAILKAEIVQLALNSTALCCTFTTPRADRPLLVEQLRLKLDRHGPRIWAQVEAGTTETPQAGLKVTAADGSEHRIALSDFEPFVVGHDLTIGGMVAVQPEIEPAREEEMAP